MGALDGLDAHIRSAGSQGGQVAGLPLSNRGHQLADPWRTRQGAGTTFRVDGVEEQERATYLPIDTEHVDVVQPSIDLSPDAIRCGTQASTPISKLEHALQTFNEQFDWRTNLRRDRPLLSGQGFDLRLGEGAAQGSKACGRIEAFAERAVVAIWPGGKEPSFQEGLWGLLRRRPRSLEAAVRGAVSHQVGNVVQVTELTSGTHRGARGLLLPPTLHVGNPHENELLPDTAMELDKFDISPRVAAFDGGFTVNATQAAMAKTNAEVFIVGSKSNSGSPRHQRRLARYRVGCEWSHLPPRARVRRPAFAAERRDRCSNLDQLGVPQLQPPHPGRHPDEAVTSTSASGSLSPPRASRRACLRWTPL